MRRICRLGSVGGSAHEARAESLAKLCRGGRWEADRSGIEESQAGKMRRLGESFDVFPLESVASDEQTVQSGEPRRGRECLDTTGGYPGSGKIQPSQSRQVQMMGDGHDSCRAKWV